MEKVKNILNEIGAEDLIPKFHGRKIAWPPHLDYEGINDEYLAQQDPEYQGRIHNDIGPDQKQAGSMDQQMMSSEHHHHHMSEQSAYKLMNQSYQVQQYQYEQQFGGREHIIPVSMQHQYEIQQTQSSQHQMPRQQFSIPVQRMQSETLEHQQYQTQPQVHKQIQTQQAQFQGHPQGQLHEQPRGQQLPSQPQGQFQGHPYGQFQNQPQGQAQEYEGPFIGHSKGQFQGQPHGQLKSQLQGQYHQPQAQFQGQPKGALSSEHHSSNKAPMNADETVEWPPKNATGPNLTTTYPSGFKLKDELEMSHQGPQVVPSQPAFKISKPMKMRGDDKWPPRKGTEDMTQEEEVREFLRPKKANRDYSEFFAQNALPNNYPAYRAPPGTQHHAPEDETE